MPFIAAPAALPTNGFALAVAAAIPARNATEANKNLTLPGFSLIL